ncbi:hypothetical protein TrVE_jg2901 [Triparma verrucosa]|uniref:Uncharacterized protein n=1 Tax=Triparma verrucosa TaxID=1606542 RepID=A0A9W7CD16_9STRA|nr:hypothetical protein TrVE_jg2901 [Triparma verrucosa]
MSNPPIPSPTASQSWEEYNSLSQKHASLRLSRQALRQATRSQPGGYSPTKRKGTAFLEAKKTEVEQKKKEYVIPSSSPSRSPATVKSFEKKFEVPSLPDLPRKAEPIILPISYLLVTGFIGLVGSWFFWHFIIGEKSFSYFFK